MAAFGRDFRSASKNWLFDATPGQSTWMVLGLFVALVVLHTLFQLATTAVAINLVPETADSLTAAAREARTYKAAVIGMAPAAALSCFAAIMFSRWRAPGAVNLPLHYPKLGYAGWIVVLLVFALVVALAFAAVLAILGEDPRSYAPVAEDGSVNSGAGKVEGALAALRLQPVLFAMAVPGVVLLVPIAEELIFRGVLFTWLAQTPVGWPGAVVLTSALWALMHAGAAPWLLVSLLFAMGLALGTLLLRFGSLWVPIACHALWNAMTSLTIFSQ